MDTIARNNAFESNRHLLHGCIKRNYPLISALRLEVEDVFQDLSLRMCRSIERFDKDQCRSLPFFLYHELQHEILNMRRRHKPYGMVGVPRDTSPDVVYLDHPKADGTYWDIPAEEDFDVSTREFIQSLPEDERTVFVRKMNGEAIKKKTERCLLASARERLAEFFTERTLEYV